MSYQSLDKPASAAELKRIVGGNCPVAAYVDLESGTRKRVTRIGNKYVYVVSATHGRSLAVFPAEIKGVEY